MIYQDLIMRLQQFWADQGCLIWQPYHTEVGAGTSNPATFLRVLGPEPWHAAYVEPCIRPADGRYGENPNRMQHYYQFQVILKPSPPNVQEIFLESLECLGLDLTRHDFRFVEDNWESPSLGAWGLGWEVWLDGMEILQFTYFQECGGLKLQPRACELTYGLERIALYLQDRDAIWDLQWSPGGIRYGDVYRESEREFCVYNFDHADVESLFSIFDLWEKDAGRLLDEGLVYPAYDHCLRMSHIFNLLDARGVFSATERNRYLLHCRGVAERCARGYLEKREETGFPLLKYAAVPLPGDPLPPAGPLEARADFVLEIGVEELPAHAFEVISGRLPGIVRALLDEARLDHGEIRVWVAPRRIAVFVEQLASRQEDAVSDVRGPSRRAAQDENGTWRIPAIKFAEAHGLKPEDLEFAETPKGEYCIARVRREGKGLDQVLTGVIAAALGRLSFPRTMGWEDSTMTFTRAIRWLVALHGGQVVPAKIVIREAADDVPERAVVSGRTTWGHRRLSPEPAEIPAAGAYLECLRGKLVLADQDERMAALRRHIADICEREGLHLGDEEALFAEVCGLVEMPFPILCSIPAEAVSLPEPVIVTPMRKHQRYFPLRAADGSLSDHFICVANGEFGDEAAQVIRGGNEKVLAARLRDARHFLENDHKRSLADWARDLDKIVFHRKLGTVRDKVERLGNLLTAARDLLPGVETPRLARVLELMKADLATSLVVEFTELEGTAGRLYALEEGLDEEIAQAIFEHRLPRGLGDELPAGDLGAWAGILDRVDSLVGYFGVGASYSGSTDTYGLRRMMLALIRVLQERAIDLDLVALARLSVATYEGWTARADEIAGRFLAFLTDRLIVDAVERGHARDIVAAAAVHAANPPAFRECVEILTAQDTALTQDFAEQAKRMVRIATDPAGAVDPSLVTEPAEKALVETCLAQAADVRARAARRDFAGALAVCREWLPLIVRFFEDILVNANDEAVRANRHALVRDVAGALLCIADFTRIEKIGGN